MNKSYQQLLVHLDAAPRCAARLDLARGLAQATGASLAALYAVTPSFMSLPYTPALGPSLVADTLAFDEQRRARTRALFDAAALATGTQAAWSEATQPPVIGVVAQQALYADLLVLGQHDPDELDGSGVPPDFAETVLAVSGKPALVVPYTLRAGKPLSTVLIAWKETRESARAVAAAMPLLQRARTVHVASWDRPDAAPAIKGMALDLDRYLKLHQVQPVWHREGGEPDRLGELLLSRSFDLDADLLVMGCYGHSRAREWVAGGTTRTVLRSMTLPVLMCH